MKVKDKFNDIFDIDLVDVEQINAFVLYGCCSSGGTSSEKITDILTIESKDKDGNFWEILDIYCIIKGKDVFMRNQYLSADRLELKW